MHLELRIERRGEVGEFKERRRVKGIWVEIDSAGFLFPLG